MLRRARSLSNHRDLTPSIYDYDNDDDIYTRRALSVSRFDDSSIARFNKPGNNAYDRWKRSQSVGRFDHLIAERHKQYPLYSTYDSNLDYYPRRYYTERTPYYFDYSYYRYYRPYYWYYTPRLFYYYPNYPYTYWPY
ncbi:unnamed protein product, partial [Didymodactylos carnosus]